ncbi:sensor histidine kinase, partial [Klebsiella oxytoca]
SGSINLLESAPPGQDGGAATASYLPDVRVALQRIAQQAERAGRVIKSVHDFVRRRDQTREPVAPEDLLDAVLPLIRLQAHKLRVQIRIAVEPQLPRVLCDRTMVEQVLLNLARNSMQAMDEPGTPQRLLELRVRRAASNAQNAWIEFQVIDGGPGIAPEIGAKLFTPFFTTRAEGMGLGLSLCRTVVEQHGGFLG